MDKSHVGMTVCMVCGEGVDILLDKQLRDRIPSRIAAMEPCDKCKSDIEGYKEKGIVLFVIKDIFFEDNALEEGSPWPHFHSLAVITEEAANRMFKDVDLTKRAMFVPYSIAVNMGLTSAIKRKNEKE